MGKKGSDGKALEPDVMEGKGCEGSKREVKDGKGYEEMMGRV